MGPWANMGMGLSMSLMQCTFRRGKMNSNRTQLSDEDDSAVKQDIRHGVMYLVIQLPAMWYVLS